MYVYVFVEVCECAQHNKIFEGSFFIEILQEIQLIAFVQKEEKLLKFKTSKMKLAKNTP